MDNRKKKLKKRKIPAVAVDSCDAVTNCEATTAVEQDAYEGNQSAASAENFQAKRASKRKKQKSPAVMRSLFRKPRKTKFTSKWRAEIEADPILQDLIKDCEEKGLSKDETAKTIQRYKRSENRRRKRLHLKRMKKVCFGCREPGHDLASCPANGNASSSEGGLRVGVCFKCGSTEHSIAQCKLKTKDFPYATCFVCGQTGHLSRDCQENPNGVYPEGGACKECGSKTHLRIACPVLTGGSEQASEFTVSKRPLLSATANHESVDFQEARMVLPSQALDKKKKTKVVKF